MKILIFLIGLILGGVIVSALVCYTDPRYHRPTDNYDLSYKDVPENIMNIAKDRAFQYSKYLDFDIQDQAYIDYLNGYIQAKMNYLPLIPK